MLLEYILASIAAISKGAQSSNDQALACALLAIWAQQLSKVPSARQHDPRDGGAAAAPENHELRIERNLIAHEGATQILKDPNAFLATIKAKLGDNQSDWSQLLTHSTDQGFKQATSARKKARDQGKQPKQAPTQLAAANPLEVDKSLIDNIILPLHHFSQPPAEAADAAPPPRTTSEKASFLYRFAVAAETIVRDTRADCLGLTNDQLDQIRCMRNNIIHPPQNETTLEKTIDTLTEAANDILPLLTQVAETLFMQPAYQAQFSQDLSVREKQKHSKLLTQLANVTASIVQLGTALDACHPSISAAHQENHTALKTQAAKTTKDNQWDNLSLTLKLSPPDARVHFSLMIAITNLKKDAQTLTDQLASSLTLAILGASTSSNPTPSEHALRQTFNVIDILGPTASIQLKCQLSLTDKCTSFAFDSEHGFDPVPPADQAIHFYPTGHIEESLCNRHQPTINKEDGNLKRLQILGASLQQSKANIDPLALAFLLLSPQALAELKITPLKDIHSLTPSFLHAFLAKLQFEPEKNAHRLIDHFIQWIKPSKEAKRHLFTLLTANNDLTTGNVALAFLRNQWALHLWQCLLKQLFHTLNRTQSKQLFETVAESIAGIGNNRDLILHLLELFKNVSNPPHSSHWELVQAFFEGAMLKKPQPGCRVIVWEDQVDYLASMGANCFFASKESPHPVSALQKCLEALSIYTAMPASPITPAYVMRIAERMSQISMSTFAEVRALFSLPTTLFPSQTGGPPLSSPAIFCLVLSDANQQLDQKAPDTYNANQAITLRMLVLQLRSCMTNRCVPALFHSHISNHLMHTLIKLELRLTDRPGDNLLMAPGGLSVRTADTHEAPTTKVFEQKTSSPSLKTDSFSMNTFILCWRGDPGGLPDIMPLIRADGSLRTCIQTIAKHPSALLAHLYLFDTLYQLQIQEWARLIEFIHVCPGINTKESEKITLLQLKYCQSSMEWRGMMSATPYHHTGETFTPFDSYVVVASTPLPPHMIPSIQSHPSPEAVSLLATTLNDPKIIELPTSASEECRITHARTIAASNLALRMNWPKEGPIEDLTLALNILDAACSTTCYSHLLKIFYPIEIRHHRHASRRGIQGFVDTTVRVSEHESPWHPEEATVQQPAAALRPHMFAGSGAADAAPSSEEASQRDTNQDPTHPNP